MMENITACKKQVLFLSKYSFQLFLLGMNAVICSQCRVTSGEKFSPILNDLPLKIIILTPSSAGTLSTRFVIFAKVTIWTKK